MCTYLSLATVTPLFGLTELSYMDTNGFTGRFVLPRRTVR